MLRALLVGDFVGRDKVRGIAGACGGDGGIVGYERALRKVTRGAAVSRPSGAGVPSNIWD